MLFQKQWESVLSAVTATAALECEPRFKLMQKLNALKLNVNARHKHSVIH